MMLRKIFMSWSKRKNSTKVTIYGGQREPSAQLPYQLYSEGPNTEDCDLITISTPLQVLKKTHQLLTEKTKKSTNLF